MTAALRLVPLLLVAYGLTACASGPDTSYVSSLSAPADASVIASDIATFMRTQLPASSTTLVLDPTPSDQASNLLTPALANDLREQGFAVAESAAPPGAHTLRYWVTGFDASGELVRLWIDSRTKASRFFARTAAGDLQNGGPFTVLQTEVSR